MSDTLFEDIKNIEDIKSFTDLFYQKLATSEILKQLFFDKLGHDDWQPHLERVYLFWEMILFGATGYTGNTFAPHSNMPINKIHFDEWLKLFNESIDELYVGETAELAKSKAKFLSAIFLSKIEFMSK
jgi:hemoglobin